MTEKISYQNSQGAVDVINELLKEKGPVEIRLDLRELLDFYITNLPEGDEGRAINLYQTVKYLTDFTYNIEEHDAENCIMQQISEKKTA